MGRVSDIPQAPDAERQIQEDKDIAKTLLKKLCLPYILSKRPDWDKFAGAEYTISIDVLMPSERTLQLGSIHQYRDNFSKPYEITYETEQGSHAHCHQTTYGMSERLLGALIGIHGDNKGLVMPPAVAPIQVVIIPIIFKGKEKEVINACETVSDELTKEGIRTHVDNRDITPGYKYYDWELKGVPLRVEIGPRDIENKAVVIVRRHTGAKKTIPRKNIGKTIKKELDDLSHDLYKNAEKLLKGNIHRVATIDDAREKKGIIELPWCRTEQCALDIETILEGNTLGEPIEDTTCSSPCPVCGNPAETWMRYAKTY